MKIPQLLLLLTIVFTSCKTSFQAHFLVPPAQNQQMLAKSIVIVNQQKSQPAIDAINAFYNAAKEIPDYHFQVADEALVLGNDSVLEESTKKAICDKYQANAVLVLEYFKTAITIEKTNLNQLQYSLLQEWEATMHLSYSLKWTLYSQGTNQQLDGYSSTYSNVFTARGEDEFAAEANLPYHRDVISNAAKSEGKYYAQRILPTWEPANRKYFKSVNANMSRAAKYARKGNWKEAASYWKKEYKMQQERTQAKSAYNLALACEMEGNIDEAIRWAQIAYFEKGFQPAGDYILALRKRALNHYNVTEHYSQLHQPVAP